MDHVSGIKDQGGQGAVSELELSAPADFLEISMPESREAFVTICSWCPDKQDKTRACIEAGKIPSHTICEQCKENLQTAV